MSNVHSFRGVIASCIVLGFAVTLPATSAAQAQTTPRPAPVVAADRDDAEEAIEDRIEFRLETDDVTRKYDIDVEVDNGVVTLKGKVDTAEAKKKAEEIAKKVDGVKSVKNELTVEKKS